MKGIKRLYSILTFLPLVVSIFACPILPQKIPAHYNLAGEVDRWGSRQEILIIPILTMVLGWIFRRWIVSTMKKQPENSERALYIGGISMLFVFNGLFFVMLYTSFAVVEHLANPENSIIQIINILVGIMLIPLGHIMPKVKRNGVFGVRTKWSMANDTCWNLSQRFGGMSFVITGILIIVGSLMMENPAYQSIFMVVMILLDAVFCIVYSYQTYQKYGKN